MKPGVLDWLYENSLRAYPFKENSIRKDGSFELANDVLLDAQITLNTHPGDLSVTNIIATAEDVTFVFSTSDPITVEKGITEITYVRTVGGKLFVFGLGLNDIPIGVYTFSSLVFEPSVVHEFGGPWKGVTSVAFDAYSPMTGILNFIEGYQFDINLALQNIGFAVGSLYGKQIGCTHFSSLPEDCDSIISFISGVGPDGNNEIFLKAGPGMVVWDDPDNNRIYVGFSFTSISDICPDIPPFPIAEI